MNVFDHDSLFEQIGFSHGNADQEMPQQYNQNLLYAAMPPGAAATKPPAGGHRPGKGQQTAENN